MDRFIKNKYFRWYVSITAASDIDSYVERHHIIPRSLGGTNAKSNIVRLTFRKHFLAHWLLTKFTVGTDRMRMLHALNIMSKHDTMNRIATSWQFELGRRATSEASKGRPSPWKGKTPTQEMLKKMSDARRGILLSSEHKVKIGEGTKKWWDSAATDKRQIHKDKIAKSKLGKTLSIKHRDAIRRGKTGSTYDGKNVSISLLGNTRKLGYKDPQETLARKREAQLRRQSTNKTGWRWVYRYPSRNKPWRAKIGIKGKPAIELGLFDCPAAAHFAAIVASDIYYNKPPITD